MYIHRSAPLSHQFSQVSHRFSHYKSHPMYFQTEKHPQQKSSDNATLIWAGLQLNHQRHSQGRSALIYAASLADHPDTFLPFCHREQEINDVDINTTQADTFRELKQKLEKIVIKER